MLKKEKRGINKQPKPYMAVPKSVNMEWVATKVHPVIWTLKRQCIR